MATPGQRWQAPDGRTGIITGERIYRRRRELSIRFPTGEEHWVWSQAVVADYSLLSPGG